MNKRQLYELIMSAVAKEVKKTINEALADVDDVEVNIGKTGKSVAGDTLKVESYKLFANGLNNIYTLVDVLNEQTNLDQFINNIVDVLGNQRLRELANADRTIYKFFGMLTSSPNGPAHWSESFHPLHLQKIVDAENNYIKLCLDNSIISKYYNIELKPYQVWLLTSKGEECPTKIEIRHYNSRYSIEPTDEYIVYEIKKYIYMTSDGYHYDKLVDKDAIYVDENGDYIRENPRRYDNKTIIKSEFNYNREGINLSITDVINELENLNYVNRYWIDYPTIRPFYMLEICHNEKPGSETFIFPNSKTKEIYHTYWSEDIWRVVNKKHYRGATRVYVNYEDPLLDEKIQYYKSLEGFAYMNDEQAI